VSHPCKKQARRTPGPTVTTLWGRIGGRAGARKVHPAWEGSGSCAGRRRSSSCCRRHILAYAPFADVLWCETSTPDLEEARVFAEAIHERFPGKLLAYNCSPSFNWRAHLDDDQIASFQRELGTMGYRFQFITLAGFHALNASMFELANAYANEGMSAYVRLQEREFELEPLGYSATRHQAEVGTGYFDRVSEVVSRGTASTLALAGSTERAQFAAADGNGKRGRRAERVLDRD